MHGNVWEWCLDWRGDLADGDNPVGAVRGNRRVLRGGGWNYDASGCASSFRGDFIPSFGYNICGFRLSCSAGSPVR